MRRTDLSASVSPGAEFGARLSRAPPDSVASRVSRAPPRVIFSRVSG